MTRQVLDWIKAVLHDLLFCAPLPMVTWTVDSRQLPVEVRLRRAEEDFTTLVVDGDDLVDAAAEFATQAQRRLVRELGVPVPACPNDGQALTPERAADMVQWRCPSGDVICAVGDYTETLWLSPPSGVPEPRLVSERLRRRGLDFVSLGVEWRDDRPVVSLWLSEGTDESALAAAVAPWSLEVTRWLPAPQTQRIDDQFDHDGQRYRALRHVGGFGHLARLDGVLRRSRQEDNGDVVVQGTLGHLTQVELLPAHRLGDTDGAFLLDHKGRPFAAVGDVVVCVGGVRPSPVRDEQAVFGAWEIRIVEAPLPRTSPTQP